MLDPKAIAALTTLARSDSLDQTLPALELVRNLLGQEAEAWKPLLETLTLRAQEMAELRRQMRSRSGELRLRKWAQFS